MPNKMDDLDDVMDVLDEEYDKIQNTLHVITTAYLVKTLKNGGSLNLVRFKNKINGILKRETLRLNKILSNSAKLLETPEKRVIRTNTTILNRMNKIVVNNYKRVARTFSTQTNTDVIYQAIKRYNDNIENTYKITYKDGRHFTFKSYMEMNVRTTLHQELHTAQDKAARDSGLFCWICDEYSDSAPDHADYQGKKYISEDWAVLCAPEDVQAIQDYIDANGILTKEYIEGAPVYLTTRPNCRHQLTPITLEQFLDGSTERVLKDTNSHTGKLKTDAYNNLQQQRQNERMIRKYKGRLDNAIVARDNAPADMRDLLDKDVAHNRQLVSRWQAKQREHIEKHSRLERDYRRESNKVILNDLGVKYHAK